MEARHIRRRHFFQSSVGSLLNENYSPSLTPASARTSPSSRNQCSSAKGSTQYIELPSDPHEENGRGRMKERGRLDAEALFQTSNNDCILNHRARSPSAISVTSSGSCLGVAGNLGANMSTLTWPECNGQASRRSTPSCTTSCSETDTYRPFSSTTNDFIGGRFRFSPVATPRSVDRTAKLDPPQYYDAYREMMNAKSRSPAYSVRQGDEDTDNLKKEESLFIPQVRPSEQTASRRASSSHSTGSAKRAASSHSTGSAKRAASSYSTGSAQRAASSHSTGSAHHAYSNRSVTPASSRVYAQKYGTTPPLISDPRKSMSRSSSAASVASLWNEQKPNVFYAGRTPSRTPSPDYRLPIFPSQAWIKHYSPTYVRHFMRAANVAIN